MKKKPHKLAAGDLHIRCDLAQQTGVFEAPKSPAMSRGYNDRSRQRVSLLVRNLPLDAR